MKTSKMLIVIAIVLTACFGSYSVYKILFANDHLSNIEPIGFCLPASKTLVLSNKVKPNKDTLVVGYPAFDYLFPNTIGYVKNVNGQYELHLDKSIASLSTENSNPYLPFCCSINKNPKFFEPEAVIPNSILAESGIKFNVPCGNPSSRISLKVINHNGQGYISFKDKGIGTQYLLDKKTDLEIAFNHTLKDSLAINYQFIGLGVDTNNYKLTITTSLLSKPNISYQAIGNPKQTLTKSNKFVISNVLFEVKPRFTIPYVFLIFIYLLALLAFQIFYMKTLAQIQAPTLYILLVTRILLNCLALLALPLAVTSITLTEGRYIYFGLILLLNCTYLINRVWLVKIMDNLMTVLPLVCLVIFFTSLISVILLGANETVGGIVPMFAVTKICVMCLLFLLSHFKKIHPSIFKYRFIIVIVICVIFLIKTSDFSLLLYTIASLGLINLITGKLKATSIIALAVLGIISIVSISNFSPSSFSSSKLSRTITPYVNPTKLTYTPERDRETAANLITTWKTMLYNENATFDNTYIPAVARSTAFSDYSLIFSTMLGSYFFLLLWLYCAGLLIYQLLAVLYLCLYAFRINNSKFFQMPVTPLAALLTFLITITVLQFILPFASQSMFFILTGVSIPITSIASLDVIFIIVLIILLEYVFNNEAFHKDTVLVQHKLVNFGDITSTVKKACIIILTILASAAIIKLFHFKSLPSQLSWPKYFPSKNATQVTTKNKDSLIALGKQYIAYQNTLSLNVDTKENLAELQSVYYTGKPLIQNRRIASIYSISKGEMICNTNMDSIYKQTSKVISGTVAPFGKVYARSQIVNKHGIKKVTNGLYANMPLDNNCTMNADFNAELNLASKNHIRRMDCKTNKTAILCIDNSTGSILADASYPIAQNFDFTSINISELNYHIASVKKLLVYTIALQIDLGYEHKQFASDNGKLITMAKAIEKSDDHYAAATLKDLLQNHKQEFINQLNELFGLVFFDAYNKSYCDKEISEENFTKNLDAKNEIYRLAIGQQQVYTMRDVAQYYARIMGGKALNISNKKQENKIEDLLVQKLVLTKIRTLMHKPFGGTAEIVADALESNHINYDYFICKTGTAGKEKSNLNSSSTFILCTPNYTFAVCIIGTLPPLSDTHKQHAKDLFNSIIPILKKYKTI
jgi:hypothetical protein